MRISKALLVAFFTSFTLNTYAITPPPAPLIISQQIATPQCYETGFRPDGSKPCEAFVHVNWLKAITQYRTNFKKRVKYDGHRYEIEKLKWAQSSFIQPQMMVHDRYFYDPINNKYTVNRYLNDLNKRYGGIDAVLIWAPYPNMGVDDRNEIDMVKSMPGGVEGVKQMVADFHKNGVKVFFPMMPWDRGTRPIDTSWENAIAKFMAEIGADGVNGDTMKGVPLSYIEAAEENGHPLIFQPEGTPPDEALAWNLMRWGQYKYQFSPMVDRFKWIETRHGVNISDRWNRKKTDNLQFAFFNGVGWESWENIWGIWNGITPRDGEATKRMATLERGVAKFLVSPDWEPLYPTQQYGVFASRWPLNQETVWTIVNRNSMDVRGEQLSIPAVPGMHYYDLYHGVQLIPMLQEKNDVLSFTIEASGFGAILATPNKLNNDMQNLMANMKEMSATPLSHFSNEWKFLPQTLVDIPHTPLATNTPEGMIKIPSPTTPYMFKVHGIELEGFNNKDGSEEPVDVQYPWEDRPQRHHHHLIDITSFYMDKMPVTNAQFKKFIDATQYHPSDSGNFLKDWIKDSNTHRPIIYPAGWDNKPVTWVSIEDARAYAKWAGKRLPHEWEWQYAAQGTAIETYIYPWGHDANPDVVPIVQKSPQLTVPPDDVNAHPEGASPFGILDMVGNVWQWTDEFIDEHTRAAIVRGGNYYQPQKSFWYFPQAYKNNEHGKLLLMAPSYDRSATIGFRCVQDAAN